MPVAEITEFLQKKHAEYHTLKHPPAITARQTAAVAHIPRQEMAKTVLVIIDGRLAMAVLPAGKRVNESLLCEVARADAVRIADEADFHTMFPGCELGAMPPLGALYNLDVYADESLCDDDEIAFNAGTHTELVVMPLDEFIRVVQPQMGKFALPF
jgi:Ala-tRNA(Pro) deacylase